MSDKLCNRLTLNYLQETKAAFIYIELFKKENPRLVLTPNGDFFVEIADK